MKAGRTSWNDGQPIDWVSDLDAVTAPWTVQVEWTRDDSYRLYEFACHEGNRQVRDLINASRAQRKKDAAKAPQ